MGEIWSKTCEQRRDRRDHLFDVVEPVRRVGVVQLVVRDDPVLRAPAVVEAVACTHAHTSATQVSEL